ncbi:unnamed protein product [Ilex paraguariensis]|uniref:Uncharacterized protein n=1 Tax=Ilex paraguariensis TaxID=185542 RepID=A0ABC8RNA4_9AQUA
MYCVEKQTISISNVEMVQQQSSGILICYDGAFKKRTKEVASAVLMFNPKGGLMDGTSKAFFANSSLFVEAVAILLENQKISNDVPPNAYATVLKGKGSWVESLILEDMYCVEKQTISMSNVEMVQQQSSGILICCDGAFKKRTKEAASAVLMFNPKGGLMDGTSKAFFANSSLFVEAMLAH